MGVIKDWDGRLRWVGEREVGPMNDETRRMRAMVDAIEIVGGEPGQPGQPGFEDLDTAPEIDAEAPRKLAEAETRIEALAAANAFLTAHTQRLIDRLVGARMMAGDMSIEAATQFVNAERGVVKSVLERAG